MKLDCNINADGRGKYALVLQRQRNAFPEQFDHAIQILTSMNALDHGDGSKGNFFVIRLKDKYAAPALAAYAMAAHADDPEYALEVLNLAKQAAEHPRKRMPD